MGACVLLGLYLAFPDKVYVFDGIMFSDVIERNVDDWRKQVFNERHLLFNPLVMALRDFLGLLREAPAAYVLIQRLNSVLAVLGLGVYFAVLRRLTRDRVWAAAGALLLGLTAGYWSRATEGQVYMLMTLWALLGGFAALRFVEERTPRAALVLSASLAAGALFHGANLALLPMGAAAFIIARRKGVRPGVLGAAAAFLAAAVAIPYTLAFGMKDAATFVSFLTAATGFYTPGKVGSASGILSYFLSRDNPLSGLPVTAFQSLIAYPWPGTLPLAGGLLAGLVCAAALIFLWKRKPEARASVILIALWGGGFVLLDALWHGGVFFWSIPCAAGLAVVVMAAADAAGPRRRKAGLIACGVLAAGLCAWNLREGIAPQSRLDNNVGYQRTLFVRDHTFASSWIVLSGFGYPNAKVYLPYFAHRTREVLEYYLERYPREKALAEFSGFLANNRRFGVPMYLLSDLVEDRAVDELLARKWGVSKSDVIRCFGPGRLIEVARQDPGFGVFMFAPAVEAPLLVAVLGYSLMTETDMTRLNETLNALREIARSMTPAQRQSLPGIMKASDYGAKLLMDGFLPYMSPESRARALERVGKYDRLQKAPDFRLRLGNIYATFGLVSDARREWTIAYEATHDPRVAASLARLPK